MAYHNHVATPVSIRAPAWGATGGVVRLAQVAGVSIRAPAWGATTPVKVGLAAGRVSIRAPAWGATYQRLPQVHFVARFNSRSRMGSDLQRRPAADRRVGFNSRSRMGSDDIADKAAEIEEMFQFALPHGERRGRCLPRLQRRAVSIRAPAWGATLGYLRSSHGAKFQFALPHGERQPDGVWQCLNHLFQFALPHGERLPSCNGRYSLHRKRTIR